MRDLDGLLMAELAQLDLRDARRACPELAGTSRVRVGLAGASALSFASNDYLGLAPDPRLAAAAAETAALEGYGASASRLVSGDLPALRRLEAALAAHLGRATAVVFPSGYQANMGAITALAGPADLIVSDALNHASLIDGCRLSRARVAVYRHLDLKAADALLDDPAARRRLLVTESLFSMDGDTAPLADLMELADRRGAILVVDEAHALGVRGPRGRGLCAEAGVAPDVLIGTLGKAFGAAGGFVTGSAPLRDLLVNRARTFIFTTALPPPVAAAARQAIEIAATAEGDERRERLAGLGERLRSRLATRGAGSSPARGPIYPVLLGDNDRALAVSAGLRRRGFFVPAIRPPTVPAGTARLRVTLSAAHTMEEVDALVDALAEVMA
jgi:8-amino-7-oxononanoate synthase